MEWFEQSYDDHVIEQYADDFFDPARHPEIVDVFGTGMGDGSLQGHPPGHMHHQTQMYTPQGGAVRQTHTHMQQGHFVHHQQQQPPPQLPVHGVAHSPADQRNPSRQQQVTPAVYQHHQDQPMMHQQNPTDHHEVSWGVPGGVAGGRGGVGGAISSEGRGGSAGVQGARLNQDIMQQLYQQQAQKHMQYVNLMSQSQWSNKNNSTSSVQGAPMLPTNLHSKADKPAQMPLPSGSRTISRPVVVKAESDAAPSVPPFPPRDNSNKRATPPDGDSDKPGSRKAPRRSMASAERMEKHKIVERKRREKTKELMNELLALIPTVDPSNEGITMNTVLKEAIQHLKEQHQGGPIGGWRAPKTPEDDDNNGQVKVEDGETKKAGLGFADAYGVGSVARDGLSLMIDGEGSATNEGEQEELQISTLASFGAEEVVKSQETMLRSIPDQEFKYFRLVLMQESLYAKMLARWESKWGTDMVKSALGLLGMARKGLSLEELEIMLKIHETGRSEQWKAFTQSMNADLEVRSEGLLGFVYSAFRLAVERRYLREEVDRRMFQTQLVEFFETNPDSKRAASELPYALEGLGEWERLKDCLSRSLDIVVELYNDQNTGDLLRFFRTKSSGPRIGGGYREASQSIMQNLQQKEQEGMEPQLLWQSSLITARFLGDAGYFKDAFQILQKARDLAKELGGVDRFMAEVSLRCAELLNKWAAATSEYTQAMMAQSASYAKEAADMYACEAETKGNDDYATALCWMGLNFATLCRLGGGGGWSVTEAKEISEQALSKCMQVLKRNAAPPNKIAEVIFGEGVLAFCTGEAVMAGYLPPHETVKSEDGAGLNPSTCDSDGETRESGLATEARRGEGHDASESCVGHEERGDGSCKGDKDRGDGHECARALYRGAMRKFEEANAEFTKMFGGKHLEVVKCVTMLGLLCRRLNKVEEALEWSRQEVRLREEIQGELHPRTIQAKKDHMSLVEEMAQSETQSKVMSPQPFDQGQCSSENKMLENDH